MSIYQEGSETTMFEGMRRLVSGVSVVTANNAKGESFAMTASSITSVSAEPPSLLVCINRTARIDHAVMETPYFCVNLLAPKHKQISNLCSTPESRPGSRFEAGNWVKDEHTGLMYLADAQAIFMCHKQAVHSYGTHNIFIGDVMSTHVDHAGVSVLAYLNGSYIDL